MQNNVILDVKQSLKMFKEIKMVVGISRFSRFPPIE